MDNIDSPYPTPLTAEQLAAVAANGGWARVKDPNTQRVFLIAEEIPPTVDDDYIRAKLDEAEEDSRQGRVAEWNLDEIKTKLQAHLASKEPQG